MPSNFSRLLGRITGLLCTAFILCPSTLPAQEASAHPSVRLDLNAGNFLNTLPFDQPFQIQGHIPQDITQIRVTFEESFNTGHRFADQPQAFAAFETDVAALLDSAFSSPRAETSPRTLQRQLNNVLRQNANLTDSTAKGSTMGFLPWNWGITGTQSGSLKLITTGTLFDPSNASTSAREQFGTFINAVKQHPRGQQRALALDKLNSFVINEVQNVRLVSAPSNSNTVQGTWQKLHKPYATHSEPLQSDGHSRWNRLEQRLQGNTATETGAFRLVMPPLDANRTYLVHVQAQRGTSDSLNVTDLHTTFWTDTHASNYVSLDVGLLYVPEIKETSVYVGSNFYLRPVAKSVPLQTRGGLLRRLAFTVGLTVQDIEDDRATRRALFGPVSVVLGAGIRVSKYLRLSSGILIFRERDPETFPLTTRTALTSAPYVSASFDLDAGKHLKGLGGLFGFTERGGAK